MRRHFCLLLVTVLAAAVWPATAGAAVFGASVEGVFKYFVRGKWDEPRVHASLESLYAAGGRIGRSGADWATTEPYAPTPHEPRYDWRYDDLVVQELAIAHLRWEPTLDYTPKWAQEHIKPARRNGLVSPLPPAHYQVYATYAAAFARRYGVHGQFWRQNPSLPYEPVTTFEIWNEPDDRWTWGPPVNLQDYARLYALAYRAIKHVDPHSSVITGGLAFNQSSMPRLLRALHGLPVDGIAVHPYGRTAQATVAVVQWTAQEMALFGRRGTPIIVNEYGWNWKPAEWPRQWAPKRTVARNVRLAISGLAKIPQVSQIIPFEWADAAWGLTNGGLSAAIKQVRGRR